MQPAITITIGSPHDCDQLAGDEKSSMRQDVAKGKILKSLATMHSKWKPTTPEGKAYNDELGDFLSQHSNPHYDKDK